MMEGCPVDSLLQSTILHVYSALQMPEVEPDQQNVSERYLFSKFEASNEM